MELPRNITQVGETDRNCKIYVEDYVVSYMRQMNRFAEKKDITIALYGKMSLEDQITYCFVYGACMIQSIAREVRHLSQAQNQEIERLRRKYFPEQEFLGYQILNGEMIEGFRIYDQNSCRYVKGYACFFEKNDTMLAYMLETRTEEAQPEIVEQDKYDEVKRRREERKLKFEDKYNVGKSTENTKTKDEEIRKFKVSPFLFTAVGCLAGVLILGNNHVQENVRKQAGEWYGNIKNYLTEEEFMDISGEVFLPIAQSDEEIVESQMVQTVMSTLVAEDKLADAILEENEQSEESVELETKVEEIFEESTEMITDETKETADIEVEDTEKQTSYVIQPGDTLIAISTNIYGSDAAVSRICELNHISNPDNIQIGQKILLP